MAISVGDPANRQQAGQRAADEPRGPAAGRARALVDVRAGRVERGLDRLYARFGSRMWFAGAAGAATLGVATLVVASLVGGRLFGLNGSRSWTTWALWTPIAVALWAIGTAWSAPQIRTILAWSGERRTATTAPDTWRALVDHPRIVARAAAVVSLVIPPGAAYVAWRFDRPWWTAIPVAVAGEFCLLAASALAVFYGELFLRPILNDVAAHLPADFAPPKRGMTLRTKALAPLPFVTVFAATIVGAYADLSSDRNLRAVLVIGVALVAVAVATMIYVIVLRSLLSPMDDLIAATDRVRAGDIQTPVPLLSADELGDVAHSFNAMLAELRLRTDELEASRADLQRNADELRTSRQRIVAVADESRRRIERDLHDGAQQQLVLLRLKLSAAERIVAGEPKAKAIHDELRADVDRALSDLRDLARGIYPASLETDGLRGALTDAAQRAAIPTRLECDGAGRYHPEIETAIYFCCLEALQNTAKHAGDGATALVRLAQHDSALEFEITDDGRGFDTTSAKHSAGVQNMTDRIGALGGTLRIESFPGNGTKVTGTLPVTA